MTTINFTKRAIEQIEAPTKGRDCYYDEYQHNLMLRVSAANKVFYVRRKFNGKSERVHIGRFPDVSIEEARKKAAKILAEFADGKHPQQAARVIAAEPTIEDLYNYYMEGHARQRCSRIKDMEKDFNRYLSDWRYKPHSQIRRSDVQNRINRVLDVNGPGAANHMIILMRSIMNWNLRNEIITGDNPWSGVKTIRIQPRERFLTPDELVRFFKALNERRGEVIYDYVLMSLYTGARRSNILSMSWEHIDLNLRIWRIPPKLSKNKETMVVPLTSNALKILRERLEKADGPWVFPGNVPGQHLMEPKRPWYKLLEDAQIEDFRLHDLRRTLASYMAMGNQSLPVIAKALGHKTIAATQIYSRLMSDPVRDAMEQAQTDIHLLGELTINSVQV